MADQPTWLRGRDVTSLTLTGVTVGTDGTLTDGTGTAVQTCLAKFDDITFNSEPVTEEISAANSARAHTVILQESSGITFTFITQSAKRAGEAANNAVNPLETLWRNYDVIKAVWARAGQTWTLYGTRGPFSENLVKGRNTMTGTLLPIDPGGVNPVIS